LGALCQGKCWNYCQKICEGPNVRTECILFNACTLPSCQGRFEWHKLIL
jgi:hypothetical protein